MPTAQTRNPMWIAVLMTTSLAGEIIALSLWLWTSSAALQGPPSAGAATGASGQALCDVDPRTADCRGAHPVEVASR